MGEAKRRKALDPNYGKRLLPKQPFVIEELDRATVPAELLSAEQEIDALDINTVLARITQGDRSVLAVLWCHIKPTKPNAVDDFNQKRIKDALTSNTGAAIYSRGLDEDLAKWVRLLTKAGKNGVSPINKPVSEWWAQRIKKGTDCLIEVT